MTNPVIGLGHVGLYVTDLSQAVAFWQDMFGFELTDGSIEHGFCFLSSRPEEEHHMLLLRGGRTAARDVQIIQQVSFRVESLPAVIGYSRKLRKAGHATMDVSHGNAIGVYFDDPDGNRCEVYWQTGLDAHQVYKQNVNLSRPSEDVLADVQRHVAEYGASGYREETPFRMEYPSSVNGTA